MSRIPKDILDHLGLIILALITLGGQIYSSMEKRRIRQEDLVREQEAKADRERIANDLLSAQQIAAAVIAHTTEHRAADLAKKVELSAAELLEGNKKRTAEITNKLDEVQLELAVNTEISKQALATGTSPSTNTRSHEDRIGELEHRSTPQKVEIVQSPNNPVPVDPVDEHAVNRRADDSGDRRKRS